MVKIGIIADDYTGANDTGLQFAKKGLKTRVYSNLNANVICEDVDTIVLDTESRRDPVRTSYKKVLVATSLLKEVGVTVFYKKIDSTLRGNIGAELDAVLDALGATTVAVVPAFPRTGRITVGGYHLVHHEPLGRTETTDDPTAPVNDSRVEQILRRQSRRQVGHIGLNRVLEGVVTLTGDLKDRRGKGDEMIVIDAVTQEDLKTIAAAITASRLPVMCGCAGLAEELPDAWGVSRKGKGVFALAGSTSAVTAKQISYLQKTLMVRVIDLTPCLLSDTLEDRETVLSSIVEKTQRPLENGHDVVVRCSPSHNATVESTKRIGTIEFESRFFNAVRTLVKAVVATVHIAGLVLTGGDTAFTACQALNVSATEIVDEVQPGVPAVKFIGGIGDGLRVVTKAGAFGEEDALVAAVKYLRRTHQP
jgi:uncharacterized protein YgbK (DUF1537 family)